jgi:hypothetical protein
MSGRMPTCGVSAILTHSGDLQVTAAFDVDMTAVTIGAGVPSESG